MTGTKAYSLYIKKPLDRIAAFLMLIAISPILLLLYCLVHFSIGSPVLFRQTRPGFRGQPFTIFKFRTMSEKRDIDGQLLPDEHRITLVGRYLRTWSLDEVPELFNVLKGEMSLVGPRPLMMRYMERYSPEQARRHDVLPGITGWAQVHGRNDLPWEDKLAMDVWYVDHQSFKIDTCILMMTLWKVIRREGINEQGHATASEFMGNQDHSSSQGH